MDRIHGCRRRPAEVFVIPREVIEDRRCTVGFDRRYFEKLHFASCPSDLRLESVSIDFGFWENESN
jgi:hypothetical protein